MKVSVAICDDSELIRTALLSYLRADPDLESVGSFGSGEDLLAALAENPADVVLLDLRMPTMSGTETAARIRASHPLTAVIYLTSYPGEVPLQDALGGRVSAALTKDVPPEDLLRIIHVAASGATVISSSVMQRLAPATTAQPSLSRSQEESAVIDLLIQGMTNEQIAERTYRSVSTVKRIIHELCHRAGVTNRTALVLYVLDERRAPGE